MRKELFETIISRLSKLAADGTMTAGTTDSNGDVIEPLIRHIDLWNRNVEFADQDEAWERPAVFVEFLPIQWEGVKTTRTEYAYRCKGSLILHIVTDWHGATYPSSPFRDESLAMLDISEMIHGALVGASGESFSRLDLVNAASNHDHEELVEQIDTYNYIGQHSITL